MATGAFFAATKGLTDAPVRVGRTLIRLLRLAPIIPYLGVATPGVPHILLPDSRAVKPPKNELGKPIKGH
jgi:hypothetical protein